MNIVANVNMEKESIVIVKVALWYDESDPEQYLEFNYEVKKYDKDNNNWHMIQVYNTYEKALERFKEEVILLMRAS